MSNAQHSELHAFKQWIASRPTDWWEYLGDIDDPTMLVTHLAAESWQASRQSTLSEVHEILDGYIECVDENIALSMNGEQRASAEQHAEAAKWIKMAVDAMSKEV